MGSMMCRCGNRISNTLFPCPTEGVLLGWQDYDQLEGEYIKALESFIPALLAGRQQEWIKQFFKGDYSDRADALLIGDIVSHFESKYRKSICECDQCGRLWVETGENRYTSYVPDEGGYAGVLRSQKDPLPPRVPEDGG